MVKWDIVGSEMRRWSEKLWGVRWNGEVRDYGEWNVMEGERFWGVRWYGEVRDCGEWNVMEGERFWGVRWYGEVEEY